MSELEFWHWWVIAAALGALDMLAQRGFFLWLGVAALLAAPNHCSSSDITSGTASGTDSVCTWQFQPRNNPGVIKQASRCNTGVHRHQGLGDLEAVIARPRAA